MNARSLVTELRSQGVILEAHGARLNVDAPAGVIDEKLRRVLSENKPAVIKLLEWERGKLEKADRRGLVIRWAEERGWIALHDPTTGEWHEARASECLPGVVEAAKAQRRRKAGGR